MAINLDTHLVFKRNIYKIDQVTAYAVPHYIYQERRVVTPPIGIYIESIPSGPYAGVGHYPLAWFLFPKIVVSRTKPLGSEDGGVCAAAYAATLTHSILCPIISWHSHFPGLLIGLKYRTDHNFHLSVSHMHAPAIYEPKIIAISSLVC